MGDETRRLLRRQEQYDVIVHVYDLIEEINTYTHVLGMGIYHSSVEVHGYEWAYGGHEVPGQTGVYAVRASSMPRTPGERIGTGEQQYVYRASYPMGTTRLSKDEVEGVIRDMGRGEYQGTRYHILQHNWYGLTIGRRILVLDRASFRACNRLVCATDDLTLTNAHVRPTARSLVAATISRQTCVSSSRALALRGGSIGSRISLCGYTVWSLLGTSRTSSKRGDGRQPNRLPRPKTNVTEFFF